MVEDFSTFTEQDADAALTVTSTRVTAYAMYSRSKNYWMYKDYGAGHFGNFSHLITTRTTSAGDTNNNIVPWMVQNNGEGEGSDIETLHVGLMFNTYYRGTVLEIGDMDTPTWDSWTGSSNTVYYVTLERNGTTFTGKIYDDSGRTNLLDTLSLTCVTTTFRYCTVSASYNNSTGGLLYGYTENLDLQEAAAGTTFLPRLMMMGCG
jgi:hypothetical protein